MPGKKNQTVMALTGHHPLFRGLNALVGLECTGSSLKLVAQQLVLSTLLRRAQPIFVVCLQGEAAKPFQLQPGDLAWSSSCLRSDAPHTSQPVVNKDFMSL